MDLFSPKLCSFALKTQKVKCVLFMSWPWIWYLENFGWLNRSFKMFSLDDLLFYLFDPEEVRHTPGFAVLG